MGRQANGSRRRGRVTALGLVTVLAAALVATLFQVIASAGPASAADWSVSLRMTKTDARKVALRADASRNLQGSGFVLAIWDTTTGARLAVCNDGVTSCGGTVTNGYTWTQVTVIPSASTTELSSVAHQYVATIAPAGDTFPAEGAAATSAPQTAEPWAVALTSIVTSARQVQFTASTNYSIPGTGYTLAIFDKTTGAQLKACNSGDTPCDGSTSTGNYFTRTTVVPRATSTELSSVPHEYVAILAGITDTLPGENLAATSPVVSADSWKLTLSAVQTSTRTLQLTAITNYSVSPSGYTLAIVDKTTGAVVKACNSGDTACSGTSRDGYYWTRATITPRGSTTEESSVPHEYVAVLAQDATALPGENVAATSETVSALPWSVSLTTASGTGSSYTLNAQSSYALTGSGYTLAVYDEKTGERVGVCGSGYATCSGASNNSFLRVIRTTGFGNPYVAIISDDSSRLPASNIAAQSGSVVPE